MIAFDFFFGRATEHDTEFAGALREAKNVVLVAFLKREILPGKGILDRLIAPTPVVDDSAFAVAAFPLPKVPARVNTFWTFLEGGGQDNPTLPVVALQTFALPAYEDFLAVLRKADAAKATRLPASYEEVVSSKQVTELVLALRQMLAADPQTAKRVLQEIQKSENLDPINLFSSVGRRQLGANVDLARI